MWAAEMARRQGITDVQIGLPSAVIDALMGDCEAARKEKSNPALVLCGDATAVRLAEEQALRSRLRTRTRRRCSTGAA